MKCFRCCLPLCFSSERIPVRVGNPQPKRSAAPPDEPSNAVSERARRAQRIQGRSGDGVDYADPADSEDPEDSPSQRPLEVASNCGLLRDRGPVRCERGECGEAECAFSPTAQAGQAGQAGQQAGGGLLAQPEAAHYEEFGGTVPRTAVAVARGVTCCLPRPGGGALLRTGQQMAACSLQGRAMGSEVRDSLPACSTQKPTSRPATSTSGARNARLTSTPSEDVLASGSTRPATRPAWPPSPSAQGWLGRASRGPPQASQSFTAVPRRPGQVPRLRLQLAPHLAHPSQSQSVGLDAGSPMTATESGPAGGGSEPRPRLLQADAVVVQEQLLRKVAEFFSRKTGLIPAALPECGSCEPHQGLQELQDCRGGDHAPMCPECGRHARLEPARGTRSSRKGPPLEPGLRGLHCKTVGKPGEERPAKRCAQGPDLAMAAPSAPSVGSAQHALHGLRPTLALSHRARRPQSASLTDLLHALLVRVTSPPALAVPSTGPQVRTETVYMVHPTYRIPQPGGGVTFCFGQPPGQRQAADSTTPMEVDASPDPSLSPLSVTTPADPAYQIMQHRLQLHEQLRQGEENLHRIVWELEWQREHQMRQLLGLSLGLVHQPERGQVAQWPQPQPQHLAQGVLVHEEALPPPPVPPPPPQERVVFTEWTLVLHFTPSRRLSERPLGRLEYEPLAAEPEPRGDAAAASGPRRASSPCYSWPDASDSDIVDDEYDVYE